MGDFNHIREKLEAFIKKYYTKVLVKGVLLFLTFGLLLFLLVTGVEFFLWLGSTARLILLAVFVVAMAWLLYNYILVPVFYLFRIKKGITEKEASGLVGRHFPEVGDKLLNLLELSERSEKSDILLAAIEQRSQRFKPLPFTEAVDLKESFKYVKFLGLPLLVIGLVWISGSIADFFGSYNRVVNYDVAYEPPAPFSFLLQNETLEVLENTPLKIKVSTEGSTQPEAVYMVIDGERFIMQRNNGFYEYTLEPPIRDLSFHFRGSEVVSRNYSIEAIRVPAIRDFKMELKYPKYLSMQDKTVNGTGNATIPEGTRVTWTLGGIHTTNIDFSTVDTVETFVKEDNRFELSKRIFKNLNYELTTSNQKVEKYERLGYSLKVIRDASPVIRVKQQRDSLTPNESYYSGTVSDDNGIREVSLVYYEQGMVEEAERLQLSAPNTNVERFYYTFPSGINTEPGKVYELYFEVTDNDGLRNGKRSKSQVFTSQILNDKELKDRELESQNRLIDKIEDNLENSKEQEDILQEINKEQRQEDNLDYKDQQKVKDFLNKQFEQEQLMEKFSRQLNESLDKEDKDSEFKELLQERLERRELEAKKNQKLLEELEKVSDKIDKEDLKKRLEELSKSQKSGKRNLEQLLELTKRYYVTEKAAQLSQKLDELAEEQKKLSEQKAGDDFSKEEQEKLNKRFEELSNELDELKGDNRALRKPIDLDYNKNQQESIKKDQQDALKEMEKNGGDSGGENGQQKENAPSKASQKQKSASDKMKELSEKLQNGMSGGGGGSSIVEDAEMLRQILDNLITFSFKQERLLNSIDENKIEIAEFSGTIREQKELKQLFEHVDDSLFALSLRRAELSEFVNEQITEVYYNMDKSLEVFAENQLFQAASYQQYVLTASNALADFLADILDNMQQSMMSGQGEGQGQGFQLPDIIKSQGELKEKMEGAQGSSGESGQQEGEGQEGKEGDKGEQQGQGQQGNEGEGGEQGQQGNDQNGQGDNGKQEGGQTGKGGEGENKGDGRGEGDGEGNGTTGLSEEQLKEIYEIYQEQQKIRQTLEEQLNSIIQNDKRQLARKLVQQMEQFENELLQNGITQKTVNRMNQIQHQLLKLENAALKQGERKERESESNKKDYSTPILTKPELLKTKTQEIEILNRQALPLRQNFQNKVKAYFGNN